MLKIRPGFVSNSSNSSFLITPPKKGLTINDFLNTFTINELREWMRCATSKYDITFDDDEILESYIDWNSRTLTRVIKPLGPFELTVYDSNFDGTIDSILYAIFSQYGLGREPFEINRWKIQFLRRV